MSYEKDIDVLFNIRGRLFTKLDEQEHEALNDAISALKTLQDMGEIMNQIMRENHKEN